MYKLTDLMKAKCNGDHELADFILGWKKIYRGITKEVDKEAAEEIFYEQLKSCKCLEKDIYEYERSDDGDAARSYAWLMTRAEVALERARKQLNREHISATINGKGTIQGCPSRPRSRRCLPAESYR